MPASPTNQDTEGDPGPFAAKLELLFRTHVRPVSDQVHARDIAASGNPHAPRRMTQPSNGAVAKAVGSTDTYVRQLRIGEKDNPTKKLVQALADFFKVDVTYLAKDDIPVEHLPRYRVGHPSVMDRLNNLFDKIRQPGPGSMQYTNDEVAAALDADFTADQIQQVRVGANDDPGLKLLQSLAAFFRVPASYLTDTDAALVARIDQQLDFLTVLAPMAARGGLPSPELTGTNQLEMFAAILNAVRQQEAVPGANRNNPPDPTR